MDVVPNAASFLNTNAQHNVYNSLSKTVCGDGRRTPDEQCDEGADSKASDAEWYTIREGYRCQVPYDATSHCSSCGYYL